MVCAISYPPRYTDYHCNPSTGFNRDILNKNFPSRYTVKNQNYKFQQIKRNPIRMEKNLYIDASHPSETRIVLKSNSSIEEYEFEDKNKFLDGALQDSEEALQDAVMLEDKKKKIIKEKREKEKNYRPPD